MEAEIIPFPGRAMPEAPLPLDQQRTDLTKAVRLMSNYYYPDTGFTVIHVGITKGAQTMTQREARAFTMLRAALEDAGIATDTAHTLAEAILDLVQEVAEAEIDRHHP